MAGKTEVAAEVLGASLGNKTMAAGAGAGFLGWAAGFNWLGLCGVVVAVLGLLANTYFQLRRDRREAAESAARIAAMRDSCEREGRP